MHHYAHPDADLGASRLRQLRSRAPPLLTTSLNNAHSLQHGHGRAASNSNSQVPISATSLSSPFSLHSAAAVATPNSASPLGPQADSPSMTYNPQEWNQRHQGQLVQSVTSHARHDSQRTIYAPRLQGPDEPVRSPPPPYSTDPIEVSPAASTPSAQFSPDFVPSSASTISPAYPVSHVSPGLAYSQQPQPASRSASGLPPPPPRPHPAAAATPMLMQRQQSQMTYDSPRAPASRRAASTGDMHRVQPSGSQSGFGDGSSSEVRYGHAIPPPPPGPHPSASRSMSLNRADQAAYGDSSRRAAPPTRRPPHLGTELGPVPPTPANWMESSNGETGREQQQQQQQEMSRSPESLHIQTEGLTRSTGEDAPRGATHTRQDSLSGLVRSPAVRNRSASALRERRSASRAGRINSPNTSSPNGEDPLENPLQHLALDRMPSATTDRQRSGKLTPQSARSFQGLDATLGNTHAISRSAPQSAKSFVKTPNSARSNIVEQVIRDQSQVDDSNEMTPPARSWHEHHASRLAQTAKPRASPSLDVSRGEARSASHTPQLLSDDAPTDPLLSPDSTQSQMDNFGDSHSEALFIAQSKERHRLFIEDEAAANTDAEKLGLFVQFMHQESRLRRVRYAEVFNAHLFKPEDLVKGMFDLPPSFDRDSSLPMSQTSLQERTSQDAGRRGSASSSGTSFADSPLDRSRSSTNASSDRPLKLDTDFADGFRKRDGAFVPALSPIASMSAVTGKEDSESRGRPPSRWWEEGSNSSGRGFDVMARSKRESKYMSALIESDQGESDRVEAASSSVPPPQYAGPLDYPIEKGGHSSQDSPSFPSVQSSKRPPFQNAPGVVDISHFTTLPPPFPRRHPAVNNNHPDLADMRTILRTLNELSEMDTAKETFEEQSREKRSRADSWSLHQRSMHEQEMQFRIAQKDITRQEYDDLAFALEDKIHAAKKQAIQNSFDIYQKVVVTPVHALLSTKIAIANNTIDTLTSKLLERSNTPLPDQPQTEGDSQPELLERLTLLKWLFEAREAAHKSQFDVISKRNELYKELVLLPYAAPGTEDNTANAAKKAEAVKFFGNDLTQRLQQAKDESVARWAALHNTIHTAVEIGVQSQLSAFWDIAPQLQELLQKIPTDGSTGKRPEGSTDTGLAKFELLIPRHEVDENAVYWEHPLRYLLSVASHAEASTRQFVDAQISLWCLDQEIREGLARAQAREDGTGSSSAGSIQRGVEELKEKVSVVEGQWAEGLGAEFDRVKLAVKSYLLSTGGWDEELEEQFV